MNHRILIIGCGSIGQRHIRCLQSIGGVDIIFLQRTASRRSLNFNTTDARRVNSIGEGLRLQPDGVIIATPHSLHVEHSLQVAEAVRNIFIEIPLAATMQGIWQLSSLVQTERARVLIGFCLRFHDVILRCKELIQVRELGRPLFVRAEVGSFLPDGRPDYCGTYMATQRELGGGVTLDLLHEVDYLYWMFGPIKSVIGATANSGVLEIRAEDISEFIVKFESGLLGSVHMDYLQRVEVRQLTVVCEKGSLLANLIKGTICVARPDGDSLMSFGSSCYEDMYVRQMRHFLNCMEGIEEPNTALSDGIHSLRVGLAVHASSERGKEVLVKEIQ